jgi:hypothetical protein
MMNILIMMRIGSWRSIGAPKANSMVANGGPLPFALGGDTRNARITISRDP